MKNKNISQIVLERIKGEKIKPISRRIFYIKKVLFWTVVTLSLIIGSFIFSLILSGLFNNDWDLYDRFGFNFIMKTLPYFWLGSFLIFTILGEYYYRKTLLGHRLRYVIVIGFYMISTIIFGSIFYFVGIGDVLEKSFIDISPVYRNIILNRINFWSQPEEGLLSGIVTKIGNEEIEVKDSNGLIWSVNINGASNRNQVNLFVDEKIKITGDIIDDSLFVADEFRSW